jgi:hypothetical protein
MAGKSDVQGSEEGSVPKDTAAGPAEGAAGAPLTVMLSKGDGDTLAQVLLAQQQHQGNHGGASVHVSSEVAHMLLTTEIMGDTQYPKVYLQRQLILVVGSGRWATLLRATKGEDWQLYLMSTEDVHLTHAALVPPHPVRTAGGHRKMLPHSVLSNPLALYAHSVARKCPGTVKAVTATAILV